MKLKNLILKGLLIFPFFLGISQTNLVQNGSFTQNSCTNFINGCVDDWQIYQGSPDLFMQSTNPYAWMWSYANGGESIITPVSFKKGMCYTVSFKVKTDDKGHSDTIDDYIKENGTINLRAVNTQNGIIVSQESVYSNIIGAEYFENWVTVTTTFTPSDNYSNLLINPFCDNPVGGGQAEMSIDDIEITEGNINVNFDFEDSTANTTNTFFEGENVYLNGSPSIGETKYKFTIQRSPINSNSFLPFSNINWTGGELSTINLSALLAAQGIILDEGYQYKVEVELSNDCKCSEGVSLTKVFEVIEKKSDLYIKDTSADTGLEPNTVSPYYWASPDIWITTSPTGTTHQNADYTSGQQHYIRVRITNRGNIPSSGTEKLYTYWAKASTGLGWDQVWTGQINVNCASSAVAGEQVTSAPITIPVLNPGQSTIITFPWTNLPNPADYSCFGNDQWHYCLLARIWDPTNDPMTYAETTNALLNTKQNNNVAWKNISILNKKTGPKVMVAVANPFEEEGTFRLESELEDITKNSIIREYSEAFCCQLVCQDCPIFYAFSEKEIVRKEVIPGKEAHTLIEEISFEPFELAVMQLDFTTLLEELDPTHDYEYRVIQKNIETGEIVGGETFLLEKEENSEEELPILEKTFSKKESVLNSFSTGVIFPNPIQAGESFVISSKDLFEEIEITDLLGQQVEISVSSNTSEYKISFNNEIKSGIYFVYIIKKSGEQEVKKLIVQ